MEITFDSYMMKGNAVYVRSISPLFEEAYLLYLLPLRDCCGRRVFSGWLLGIPTLEEGKSQMTIKNRPVACYTPSI